jgi:hypothetical protein
MVIYDSLSEGVVLMVLILGTGLTVQEEIGAETFHWRFALP